MAKSINLRVNDELEKRLEEKVEEIKKKTPLGAEVNNSTVIRGALIEFFENIDREKEGKRKLEVDLRGLSSDELKLMHDIVWKGFCSELLNMEQSVPVTKVGQILMELSTFITTQIARENKLT